MNWDRLEGQWKQQRGKAERYWGNTMNDELATIAGKYEELVGILQEKHGIAKEGAKKQIELFKIQCTACRLRNIEQTKKFKNKLREMQEALNKKKKATKVKVRLKTRSRIQRVNSRQRNLDR
jgi:uncharacterized protein YjbJ (UPF0337 family)